MIKKLLWLFLLLPICTQAQISGRLLDSETHEPIPYAQITVAHPKTQIYTTENGHFSFTQLDKNTSYVLHIDALGYFNKEMNSSELNHQQDIYLDLNEEVLPELYIIPENAKTRIRTYGQTREGSERTLVGGCSPEYLESLADEQTNDKFKSGEYGILFRNKGLSKILSAHLHLHKNYLKKALIKIQLYEVIDGKPSNPIVHEPIIFNINDKQTGWFKINLENQNIYINKDVKRVIMFIKMIDKVDYPDETDNCLYFTGIFPATSNLMIYRHLNDDGFSRVPVSIPLYLKAETYSW